MQNKLKTAIEKFSSHLFWDVDRNALDVDSSRYYIIERVLSHGMISDWQILKEIYGKDEIKKIVMQLRYLDNYSLHFCVAYFNEPITNFRCYSFAQSNHGHWDY